MPYYGVTRLNKTIDVLSTRRYRELMDEIIPGGLDPTWTANTNWNDKVFGLGLTKVINFLFQGYRQIPISAIRQLLSRVTALSNLLLLKGIHYASISTTTSGHG